jgi:hypothetical protein
MLGLPTRTANGTPRSRIALGASIQLNNSLSILMPHGDCRRTSPTTINVGVLEPGTELVAETFHVIGPNPQVYMNENYTPLLCFREIPTMGTTFYG